MSEAPTPYAPVTAFDSFNPSAMPNMGRDLDNELGNIETALTDTQDRLAEIQRDDGALANGSVGPDQLQSSVFAGINTPESWVAATDYVVRDSVFFITASYSRWYKCIVDHTAGVFATDLASGYWELVLDAPVGPAGAGTASAITPTAITVGAGTVGVTTAFSRDDHVHPLTTTTQLGTFTTTQVAGLTSVQLAADGTKLGITATSYVGGFLNGGSKASEFTPAQGTAYDVDCTAAITTVNLGGMTSVQLGQEIKLNKFGTYGMYLKGTVNGVSNMTVSVTSNETYRYSGSSWGWN